MSIDSAASGFSNLAPSALPSVLAPRWHQDLKSAFKQMVRKGLLIHNQRA